MAQNFLRMISKYKHLGETCYLCPVRKSLVKVCSEEKRVMVAVEYIVGKMNIPLYPWVLEKDFKGAEIDPQSNVFSVIALDQARPRQVAIIEIRISGRSIASEKNKAILEYAKEVNALTVIIANGKGTIVYKWDEKYEDWFQAPNLPNYDELVFGFERFAIVLDSFAKLQERFDQHLNESGFVGNVMAGVVLKKDNALVLPALNLSYALLDSTIKFCEDDHGLFRVLKDCGIAPHAFKNEEGETLYTFFRHILVEYNNGTQLIGLGFAPFFNKKDRTLDTSFCVTMDCKVDAKIEKRMSLQIPVESSWELEEDAVAIYHKGNRAAHTAGLSLKEMRKHLQEKLPNIVRSRYFYFGSLANDKLWKLDNPDVVRVLDQLIAYALVRDGIRTQEEKFRGV